MQPQEVVEGVYNEFNEIMVYLKKNEEASMFINLDNHFKKVLVIAASCFETVILELVIKHVKTYSREMESVVELIRANAISRKYHLFFDWKETNSNANHFFKMFGPQFLELAKKEVNEDPQLSESIKSFLELGRIRNNIVHENFAIYSLEKTTEEIYSLYKKSLDFIKYIERKLN